MIDTDSVLRELPNAVGPEKSVLSTIIQDPAEFIPLAIESGLDAEDFYLPARKEIFQCLCERFKAGQDIELVGFTQWLLDNGRLDRIGGASALYELYTYAPSPTFFDAHIRLLRDKRTLRDIISMGNHAITSAYDSPGEAGEVLGEVERTFTSLVARANGAQKTRGLGEILKESLEAFENRVKGAKETQGILTGTAIDEHLHGLHPGRVYVICAYPKGGKSVLASQIIIDAAVAGIPAMFLTMEMTEREIMDRMIIQTARMEAEAFSAPRDYAFKRGNDATTNGAIKVVNSAIHRIAQSKLVLKRPHNRTLQTILSEVRKAHREKGIQIAAIDFAQLIKSPGKTGVEEVEEISHAIHQLSQDLQIAIILPSQLNADGDTKGGRVLEEDASAVLNIVQDRNKESETFGMHRHILIVADRFHGAGGTKIPMILDKERIRFIEGADETNAKTQKPKFNR